MSIKKGTHGRWPGGSRRSPLKRYRFRDGLDESTKKVTAETCPEGLEESPKKVTADRWPGMSQEESIKNIPI